MNIQESFSLPDIFDIVIPQRNIACRAKVLWRDKLQARIEFLAGAALAVGNAEDYVVRIKALEALNSRLKSEVGELRLRIRRLSEEA